MKAYEIMDALFAYGAGHDYSNTCDTWKAGNPDAEVQKVAVTMFPTVDVIRRAGEWGAQLLIVHEPLYYNHMDRHSREPIEVQKRRLLEQTGMAVFRIHDHMHDHFPDLICQGQMKKLALPGEEMWTGQFDLVRLTLDTPMTPVEVARRVEERFGIAHVRICGTRDVPCTHISGMFGSPGGIMEELTRPETEILMAGEACEWMQGEYARDANALGYRKSLLILGHVGSEQAGMEYLTELLRERFPELEAEFFDAGEVYGYTE